MNANPSSCTCQRRRKKRRRRKRRRRRKGKGKRNGEKEHERCKGDCQVEPKRETVERRTDIIREGCKRPSPPLNTQ
jgi:hypothetical protein